MSDIWGMNYASVCSGAEAFGPAWHELGYKPVFHAEIENHASAVLRYHYPSVPNYGDFTQIGLPGGPEPTEKVDLLCGGTPCFVAGTAIVTSTGIRPIEQVRVGDLVLTHELRWKPVLRIGSKEAETVLLKGHGSSGIETTAEHPFYAQEKVAVWNNERRDYDRGFIAKPKWVEAQHMESLFWGLPTTAEAIDVPAIKLTGNETHLPTVCLDLYWVMGAWLGDGWTRIKPRRSYVLICADKKNHLEIGKRLTHCGLNFSTSEERTTIRYQIASSALAKYLSEHFGAGAYDKTMPAWALYGLDDISRAALFEGYRFADGFAIKDGHGQQNGVGFTTISPCLSTGVRLLGASLGYSVGETLCKPNRELTIEGRKVNERPFYSIRCHSNTRTAIKEGDILWQKVKSYKQTHAIRPVFNLEVADDNSYVAGGIIVHNCQTYSVAGLREGLDSYKGGLTLEFVKLAKRLNADWLLWENVPGVLSADGGRAFGTFLGTLAECGFGFAYRILDLQHFGCPQRRKRVFLVAHSGGDWQSCAAVLFESESLRGNPAPSRKAGQEVTGTLSSRTSGGGGLGTDFDCAGGLVPTAYGGGNTTSINLAPCLLSKARRDNFSDEMFLVEPNKADTLLVPSVAAYGGGNTSGEIKVATYLTTGNQRLDFDTETFLLEPVAKEFQQNSRDELRYIQGDGQVTGALSAEAGMHQQNFIHVEPVPNSLYQDSEYGVAEYPTAGTLRAGRIPEHQMVLQPAIAFQERGREGGRAVEWQEEQSYALLSPAGGGRGQERNICAAAAVRRLMPVECERLMGWSDSWTKYGINAKGKQYELADGPRYRICGNGWGQPVVTWIAKRILMVDALLKK